MEYESITDFLFEGNSPDVLTEEQRYDFLLEYFEEEYLEDLNEEELGELYELVEGIVMKAIGGLAKRGLTAAKDKAVGAAKSAGHAAHAAGMRATDATKRGLKKAGAATLRGAGKAARMEAAEVPEEEAESRYAVLMAELVEEIKESTHIRLSDRKALCEQLAKGREGQSSRENADEVKM